MTRGGPEMLGDPPALLVRVGAFPISPPSSSQPHQPRRPSAHRPRSPTPSVPGPLCRLIAHPAAQDHPLTPCRHKPRLAVSRTILIQPHSIINLDCDSCFRDPLLLSLSFTFTIPVLLFAPKSRP